MNAHNTIHATRILGSVLALGILSGAWAANDEDYIESSKPHRLPRLMTLQTAEVLESYGIGFAGSGNIHKTLSGSEKGVSGSVYAGLGDVAELGYDQEALEISGEGSDKRMRGHIKIQPVHESKWIPAIAVAYGSSLARKGASDNLEYGIERQTWMFGISKSFPIANYHVSLHPALTVNDDALYSVNGINVPGKPESAQNIAHQLGVTWQSTESTMFILENYGSWLLDPTALASSQLKYNYGVHTNIGVRFYLRNWIFMDAGILSLYDTGNETWQNGIHANFTGIIPTKTVAERISGHFR